MFSLLVKSSFGVNYEARGDTLLIISGPGQINKEGVRSQGKYELFEEVNIEEGPTEITDSTFWGCRKLRKITIPKSVTKIVAPFFRNPILSEIIVNSENTKYYTDSEGVLLSKDNNKIVRVPAKDVTLNEGPTRICKYAFGVGTGYKWSTIVIPKSVTVIEGECFCEGLYGTVSFAQETTIQSLQVSSFQFSHFDEFRIPTSVKTIEKNAFYGGRVNKLVFEPGSKLETIKTGSFRSTTLESIVLPDSLVTIEDDAFYFSTVKSVTIGEMCSNISALAFSGCTKLREFIISDANEHYSSYGPTIMNKQKTNIIFISSGITNLTIAESVTEIGSTLLQQQENLEVLEVQKTNQNFAAESGALYSPKFDTLIAVCGGVANLVVNENVVTIGENAAATCKKLKSVTFSGSLCTKISDYAFLETSLPSFTLPKSVITLGTHSFKNNKELITFTIPDDSSLQTISNNAFEGDVFETIKIPKSIVTIKNRAFLSSKIKKVEFAPSPNIDFIAIKLGAFMKSSLESIKIPNSVTTIEASCFESCHNLSSITFEEVSKLQTIEATCFYDCISLTSIEFPTSCQSIGERAFSKCTALSSVTYSALNSIGSSCFSNCQSLESFFIGLNVKEINSNTFIDCNNLQEFTVAPLHEVFEAIEGSVFLKSESTLYLYPPARETAFIPKITLKFRPNAFSGCNKLKNLIFQSGCKMTTFGNSAFFNCVSLQSILFPPLITTIEDNCFKGCISLRSVYLPSDITTIGKGAFHECTKLRIVKYCGTNTIGGSDAFPSTLEKIYVTQYYNHVNLCSIPVSKTLGDDCELKRPAQSHAKCFGRLSILSTLSFFLIF